MTLLCVSGCFGGGSSTQPPADAQTFQPDECKASLADGARATLIVGEGQTTFHAIDENVQLTWERGPQGGHHVWIALRARGLRRQGTISTIDMEDVENPARPISVNHTRVVFDLSREDGGTCQLPGLRMQLDNAGGLSLAELLNHHVRVTAKLRDTDGAEAIGTKTIIVMGALKDP